MTSLPKETNSPRWLVWAARAGLAAGVLASVFANGMHAQPSAIARGIAAWAPLAFFGVMELLAHLPPGRSLASGIRFASAAVVGGVAAWVSYWHMVAVAARFGEQYPHLLPLSVDGLIVFTSTCLIEMKRRARTEEKSAHTAKVTPAPAPARPPSERILISAAPPAVTPVRKPRPAARTTPNPAESRPPGRPIDAERQQHRDIVARSVIAGTTTRENAAQAEGVSVKSIGNWVAAYRERNRLAGGTTVAEALAAAPGATALIASGGFSVNGASARDEVAVS